MYVPAGRPQSRFDTASTGSDVRRHRPDYWLIVLAAFLAAIGLVVVYAISPALSAVSGGSGGHYVSRQLIAIGLSIVAFLLTARIPLKTWQRWQKPLLVLAALGTLVALLTPVLPQYPAHRWIRLGGLSLQSVEALKFALIIWLAGLLAQQIRAGKINDSRATVRPIAIAVALVAIVVAGIQSDLGSTGVIVVMMGAMAFIAGLPMKRIMLIGLLIVVVGVLAISAIPYRRERLLTFLHPTNNCLTTGYQACQALIATGSGGMIGRGLGGGASSYGYLPEAQNDSIFAIYAEKFGFIGCMVLLGLFVTLFARLRLLVERAPNDFSRLVVTGILAWFSTQALINIGAMIGVLPLKGITLPFISYGGTSVLFVGAALGLAFQVSHYTSFSSRVLPHSSQRGVPAYTPTSASGPRSSISPVRRETLHPGRGVYEGKTL